MRPFVVTYRGRSMTVDLGGYYFDDYDEGIHVGDDMAVSEVVLQSLKDEHAGEVDQAASTSASSARRNSSID
jgi:HTH-type transcriptional regulator/antitoxin MqsA